MSFSVRYFSKNDEFEPWYECSCNSHFYTSHVLLLVEIIAISISILQMYEALLMEKGA